MSLLNKARIFWKQLKATRKCHSLKGETMKSETVGPVVNVFEMLTQNPFMYDGNEDTDDDADGFKVNH